MLAIVTHATELAMEASQSFANLRHRPNQPNLRSTTRLGTRKSLSRILCEYDSLMPWEAQHESRQSFQFE